MITAGVQAKINAKQTCRACDEDLFHKVKKA